MAVLSTHGSLHSSPRENVGWSAGLGSSEDGEGDEDAGGRRCRRGIGEVCLSVQGMGEGSSVVTEKPIVLGKRRGGGFREQDEEIKEKRLSDSAEIERKELVIE